ncbi:hypothetical protein GCM10023085_48930 [Actinomadura viridis]
MTGLDGVLTSAGAGSAADPVPDSGAPQPASQAIRQPARTSAEGVRGEVRRRGDEVRREDEMRRGEEARFEEGRGIRSGVLMGGGSS